MCLLLTYILLTHSLRHMRGQPHAELYQVDCNTYTRPLRRVPSPQVGIGIGYKRKVDFMVLTNTVVLLVTVTAALDWSEWSVKQTMSGGVWICIRVICVIFLSKSKGKMPVQTRIRWYCKGDMLCVPRT